MYSTTQRQAHALVIVVETVNAVMNFVFNITPLIKIGVPSMMPHNVSSSTHKLNVNQKSRVLVGL